MYRHFIFSMLATGLLAGCGGGDSTPQQPSLLVSETQVDVTLNEDAYTTIPVTVTYQGSLSLTDDSDAVSFRWHQGKLEAYLSDTDQPSYNETITVTLAVADLSETLEVDARIVNASLERRQSLQSLARTHYHLSATRQIGLNWFALAAERLYWQGALNHAERDRLQEKYRSEINTAFDTYASAYTEWQALADSEDEAVWREVQQRFVNEKIALANVFNHAFNAVSHARGLPVITMDTSDRVLPGFFYGNPELGQGDYAAFQYYDTYAVLGRLAIPAARCTIQGVSA